MISRERVLKALKGETPDRVPHCEFGLDVGLMKLLMGWGQIAGENDSLPDASFLTRNLYSPNEAKAIAHSLELDAIFYNLRTPIYAEEQIGVDGRPFYGAGLIRSEADIDLIQLPDPNDERLYDEAKEFVDQKDEFAVCFLTRIGVASTLLSVGLETFSLALYDNRRFVERVLDIYCEWSARVAEKVSHLGFDFYASADDIAYKSGPFFSPQVFREVILPRYRYIADGLTLPWVVHSDGNLTPLLDDFVDLGIAGLHPIERGAMDIRETKRSHGDLLCLLGNVDLNTLAAGKPEDVDREVRGLILDVAPGGGYIISSGNSLASYLRPKNVRAMTESTRQYGQYPISIS